MAVAWGLERVGWLEMVIAAELKMALIPTTSDTARALAMAAEIVAVPDMVTGTLVGSISQMALVPAQARAPGSGGV